MASLSVVIPLGPGEIAWRALLGDLSGLRSEDEVLLIACSGVGVENSDEPATFELPCPLRRIASAGGRARQLNAGAEMAVGEYLWFLHADSRLEADTLPALFASITTAPDALGYFDLAFGDGPALMRLNAFGARVRSRWLGLPFGDQGFFLHRDVFRTLGGFDETRTIGEDHALVWAARRAGVSLRAAGAKIHTSARRYVEHGWLRTTLRHVWLTMRQACIEARR